MQCNENFIKRYLFGYHLIYDDDRHNPPEHGAKHGFFFWCPSGFLYLCDDSKYY